MKAFVERVIPLPTASCFGDRWTGQVMAFVDGHQILNEDRRSVRIVWLISEATRTTISDLLAAG